MMDQRLEIILAAKDLTGKAFNDVNKGILGISNSLKGLATAFGAGLSVYGFYEMGKSVFEAGQRTLVANNAYKEITGTVYKANQEFEFLSKTADKLGLNFYTMREGYKGFLAAAQHSKIPMEEVRNIFQSVSNAGAILGLSNERMSLTFLALEQMMSKGKVSMEEIRRQMGDNIPGAFQLGAKAMGMTVEQFDKAVSAGEVFSEDFLPKFRQQLDKTFTGTIDESVKQINKLSEAWEGIKVSMAESGYSANVVKGITDITASLTDPKTKEGLNFWAKVWGAIAKEAGFAASVLIDEVALIGNVGNSLTKSSSVAKSQGEMRLKLLNDWTLSADDLRDKLAELESHWNAKETEDSWARTGYSGVKELTRALEDARTGIWVTQKAFNDMLRGIPKNEEAILKTFLNTPEKKLEKLKKDFEAFKTYGSGDSDVTKAYLTEISKLEKQISAPAKKAAEAHAKALSDISQEYKELAITTGHYADAEKQLADLKVDKYYADQADIVGKNNQQLKETVALMRLRNQQEYDFQNRYSNIGMTWDDSDLTPEKILENTATSDQANTARIKSETERMLDEYFNDLERMEDSFQDTTDTMRDAFKGWADDWSRTLNDMVWGAETSFESIAESFSKMLTQMLLQKYTVEPFFKFLTGDEKKKGDSGFLGTITSGLSGLFGGGVSSGTFDPFSLISFDTGGVMGGDGKKKGFPAIVHAGEEIGTPGQMMARYGDQKSANQTTNVFIYANDAKSFADQNSSTIISIVEKAMTGNTGLRQTMRGTI